MCGGGWKYGTWWALGLGCIAVLWPRPADPTPSLASPVLPPRLPLQHTGLARAPAPPVLPAPQVTHPPVAAFRVRVVVKEEGQEEAGGAKRLVIRMFEFCDGRRQWDDFSYRKCLGCVLPPPPLFVPLALPLAV